MAGGVPREPRWQRARATPAAPCARPAPFGTPGVMPRAVTQCAAGRAGPGAGDLSLKTAPAAGCCARLGRLPSGGAIPPAWPGLAFPSCVTVTVR